MDERDGAAPRRVVYTLGTSTRSLGEFMDILRVKGITTVCDVRSFPTSRRFPHFNSQPFSASLQEAGFSYLWLGELLGGYRKEGYAAYTESDDFRRGIEELEKAASTAATAVVCAELLPWKCHRRFIASALQAMGWEVVHVLDAFRDWNPSPRGENLSLFGHPEEDY
jgi:uncharacterized protein (DUF488 family)